VFRLWDLCMCTLETQVVSASAASAMCSSGPFCNLSPEVASNHLPLYMDLVVRAVL
jgi:hypothetical protein